jgi:hypothetical protein
MAFTVETGTGSATSNSYATVAEADTYFLDRNIADWAALDNAVKQAALIEATSYINNNYYLTGCYPNNEDQALQVPCSGLVDCNSKIYEDNEIPAKLKEAVLIAAKQFSEGTKLNDPIERATKSEKAGSVAVEYMDGATSQAIQSEINSIMNFLTCGNVSISGTSINVTFKRG